MTSAAFSSEYWMHLTCKAGSLDMASIVLAGRDFDPDSLKCDVLRSECGDIGFKTNTSFEKLDLLVKNSDMNAYKFHIWAGKKKHWDMYECPSIYAECHVGDQKLLIEVHSEGD